MIHEKRLAILRVIFRKINSNTSMGPWNSEKFPGSIIAILGILVAKIQRIDLVIRELIESNNQKNNSV